MSDVDFGDVLDMLARDAETRAILMYVEGITHARKFMSAARGVARIKPVIVLKAGRHAAAAKAAASHTGSMAGSAAVYNAAFARAGLVRVTGLGELFDAAETLGYGISPRTERLAILTNGGGVGIIATDLLLDEAGELATLLPKTLAQLDKQMPRGWSHGNPVDIVGDADGPRNAAALDALADDRGVGAVLAMNVPTALTSSEDAARAIAGAAGAKVVPVIGCWIGGPAAAAGREVLHAAIGLGHDGLRVVLVHRENRHHVGAMLAREEQFVCTRDACVRLARGDHLQRWNARSARFDRDAKSLFRKSAGFVRRVKTAKFGLRYPIEHERERRSFRGRGFGWLALAAGRGERRNRERESKKGEVATSDHGTFALSVSSGRMPASQEVVTK